MELSHSTYLRPFAKVWRGSAMACHTTFVAGGDGREFVLVLAIAVWVRRVSPAWITDLDVVSPYVVAPLKTEVTHPPTVIAWRLAPLVMFMSSRATPTCAQAYAHRSFDIRGSPRAYAVGAAGRPL